jgi:hypothetical protein
MAANLDGHQETDVTTSTLTCPRVPTLFHLQTEKSERPLCLYVLAARAPEGKPEVKIQMLTPKEIHSRQTGFCDLKRLLSYVAIPVKLLREF